MTEHALAACARHPLLGLVMTSSNNGCTTAPCDPIALACHILRTAPVKEGRLIAEDGSGRPFRVMRDEPSADQCGGVSGHGGLTGFGGGDHLGLQLDLLGCHFGAGLDGGAHGIERIFGNALSGLELADLLECHGKNRRLARARAPDANIVTRGGRGSQWRVGQLTIWHTQAPDPAHVV
jgi:hypothetical protein